MKTESYLSAFFEAIESDNRISITHIGIYAALIRFWETSGFAQPMMVYCNDIKPIAKINSSTTYHRAVKDLHEFGYLEYRPSFKRNQGSQIFFVFDEGRKMKRKVYENNYQSGSARIHG